MRKKNYICVYVLWSVKKTQYETFSSQYLINDYNWIEKGNIFHTWCKFTVYNNDAIIQAMIFTYDICMYIIVNLWLVIILPNSKTLLHDCKFNFCWIFSRMFWLLQILTLAGKRMLHGMYATTACFGGGLSQAASGSSSRFKSHLAARLSISPLKAI